jgi:hypothetical protein
MSRCVLLFATGIPAGMAKFDFTVIVPRCPSRSAMRAREELSGGVASPGQLPSLGRGRGRVSTRSGVWVSGVWVIDFPPVRSGRPGWQCRGA